ncbi:hypothetical protein H9W91_07370 [Streptomyces alfalfae]|uniref:hypothetical protein n=1 Tax=Streptomyces alfalfae TaxID=1642299 RepID=UPI001BADA0AA|nr:hypothetical protein [Streptomyces alfalfae]QUI30698.1 hypothetical protein H9W91_07370 [Streptomyces alfalfae]
MTAAMTEILSALNVGENVTAMGVDTRGHKVTRTGTLLGEPKQVKAQRDGKRVTAWRVFVGQEGTSLTDRSTWVTLFADSGSVERLDDIEGQEQGDGPASEWQKRKMADFVLWGNQTRYFWYAGPAKRKPLSEGRMVRVRGAESRRGSNRLVDVHTNEVVDTVNSASNIWAVPATDEEIADMPPLVELENGRPNYSLPPEERTEPLGADVEADHTEPRKPVRSGVLFEGWLGERDETGGFKVWDNARRRIIGWLSADYSMFRPVGG